MTKYAGEDLLIWTTTKNWNKTPMGPDDIVSVTITLFDTDNETILLDEVEMDWDVDEEEWITFFTFPAAGSYRARHLITGMDGKESVEWKRYRVRRQPLTGG